MLYDKINVYDKIQSWVKKYMFLFIFVVIFPVLIYFTNILSYVNTQLKTMRAEKPLKVIVFDLDETLGYFTEISIFWEALENFYGINQLPDKFFEVLDIFPEFFRPNILTILAFINEKKKKNKCYKTFIYTNNQGPKSWVTMISDYCSQKLGHKVFDHIISAYKVRGKQIEFKRTSHDKSVTDLVNCTGIPAQTEICFIDDLYHPLMDVDNVYYINIKPYRFSMPFEDMARRYYEMVLEKNATTPLVAKSDFIHKIVAYMNQFNYLVVKKSADEINVDKAVSKKLLANLEEFLKPSRGANAAGTRKQRSRRSRTLRRGLAPPHPPLG
jgi:hypothetical protein